MNKPNRWLLGSGPESRRSPGSGSCCTAASRDSDRPNLDRKNTALQNLTPAARVVDMGWGAAYTL